MTPILRRRVRGFGRLLAALLLLLALSLPGGAHAQTVLKAAFNTNPPSLDPLMSSTTASRQVAIYVWESLVTIGENYEVVPQLAESWEVSPDGLTFTFRLRSGVRFHNGDTLDAEDVASSLRRGVQHSVGASRFTDVQSVEAVDPLTVRVTLSEPYPLLAALSMPVPFMIVTTAEINEKYGKEAIVPPDLVGTGPFRFVEWRPDVHVRLARFDDYSRDMRFDGPTGFAGRRTVHFDEVLFLPVVEPAARMAGIETGEFDFIESAPVNTYATLEENPATHPIIIKPKWAEVVRLNHASPWVGQRKFRQALVYALNMEDVLKAVTQGRETFYRVQPSIFFPEQTDFYTTAGSEGFYNSPDLAKVRQLLDEVGYKGEEIHYVSNRDFDWMYKASLAVAAQWTAAGINVKLTFVDWPAERQIISEKTGWDMAADGWSPRFDPLVLNRMQVPDQHETAFYANEEVTRLFQVINRETDLSARQAAWYEIQRIIWEDVYMVRIGDYFEMDGIRADLEGYRPFYVTPRFWDVRRR